MAICIPIMSGDFVGGVSAGVTNRVLDTLSVSAAAAYSTRKLRNAYAGKAIKVRRSSDNTTQDIGFSGQDLDTGALATFVGANSAFVDTWYDQSGNGNNLTQATQANQLRIVNAGTNDTQNNKVAPNNTDGTKSITVTTGTFAQPMTMNIVSNFSNSPASSRLIADYANAPCFFMDGATLALYAGTIADTSSSTITGAMVLTGVINGASSNAWRNGSQILTNGNCNTTNPVGVDIGFLVNGSVNGPTGLTCEVVFFTSAIGTTDRQTLEANQKTYWGTP